MSQSVEDTVCNELNRRADEITNLNKEPATVLDRESASTARYDANIDKLEAESLSLWQLLKEYREGHWTCVHPTYRCSVCRKYDALEGK